MVAEKDSAKREQAEGKSEIDDIYHIERGYANIIEKLKNLGADIRKITYTQV